MLQIDNQTVISDMFSDYVKKQASLANMVKKLIRKQEKLLEDQELQLPPTRDLVPGPLIPTTLGLVQICLYFRP